MNNSKKKQLLEICEDRVVTAPSELKKYARSKFHGEGIEPVAAVFPQSTEEIVKLVNWARETKTPLVPVSSEGEHYSGGSNPSVPEAVMVDLSKMKTIHSVNRQFRIVVMDPGVTYEELIPALEKEGMYLTSTLAPKAGKSVIASLLESEPRIDPSASFNYHEPLRATRTVWGDGKEMGTGMGGSGPIKKMQEAQKWQNMPGGPGLIDYYRMLTRAEGTMGIVCWASAHTMLKQKYHELWFAPSDDLSKVIDFVYRITRVRFGAEIFILSGSQFANLMGKDAEDVALIESKTPAWVALVGIASAEVLPEMKFAQQKEDISDLAIQCDLELVPALSGIAGKKALEKITHPCEPGKYWKETRKGAFKDIVFVSTMDRVPEFAAIVNRITSGAGLSSSDIGVYIQPQYQGVNASICFTLTYDPKNAAQAAKVSKVFDEASKALCDAGAYFNRPYGSWAKMQLNKDAQQLDLLRYLRGVFNPDNVLNPGKLSDF